MKLNCKKLHTEILYVYCYLQSALFDLSLLHKYESLCSPFDCEAVNCLRVQGDQE